MLPPPGLRSWLAACGVQEAQVPCVQSASESDPPPTLERRTARFAPTEIARRPVAAVRRAIGRVLAKLVEASKIDRRAVPAAGVGRQRGDAARSGPRPDARRPRAAALLPDQQGPVVAAGSQRGVRAGRAAQAGGRELLSGRRAEGGDRALDCSRFPRRSARARPASSRSIRRAGRRVHAGAVQRRVPERARAHRGAAARGRRARRRADAQDVSRRSAPTRFCRTTTTTATWRGWS